MTTNALTPESVGRINDLRAANYPSVGAIYIYDHPLGPAGSHER